MNGYKTGGDWTDVTSISRNEVVFEGRHKAYGAFYIRQRYQSALLVALLSAIGFIGSFALIAYAFRVASHISAPPVTDIIAKPREVLVHRDIIVPPISHPPVQPLKPTPRFAPPVIINKPDTQPPAKPDEHPELTPPGTPGTGIGLPDPNQGGGSVGTPLPPPDNKSLIWASEMPKFPGGDIKDYLAKQIRYPSEESQLGVEGIVYVSFIIERDGSVSNVKLERGVSGGPGLNKEAIRVLSEMPKWTPGKQDGHPVRIQYLVPIHFQLH